jgi:hypothetical protein
LTAPDADQSDWLLSAFFFGSPFPLQALRNSTLTKNSKVSRQAKKRLIAMHPF